MGAQVKGALWITGGILATLGMALVILLMVDPDPEPAGPIGRELAAPSQWSVQELDLVLVDRSCSTPASGELTSSPVRTLATTVWLPASDGAGGLPLVVYA